MAIITTPQSGQRTEPAVTESAVTTTPDHHQTGTSTMSLGTIAQLALDTQGPAAPLRRINGVNGTGVSGNYWLDLTPW